MTNENRIVVTDTGQRTAYVDGEEIDLSALGSVDFERGLDADRVVIEPVYRGNYEEALRQAKVLRDVMVPDGYVVIERIVIERPKRWSW